jgi:hypothetical protein
MSKVGRCGLCQLDDLEVEEFPALGALMCVPCYDSLRTDDDKDLPVFWWEDNQD